MIRAKIDINGMEIGWVMARRTEKGRNGGLPDADEVHVYEVSGILNGFPLPETTVTHRYGDGALYLMSKVMLRLDS